MDLNIGGDRSAQWNAIQQGQGASGLKGAGPGTRAFSKDSEYSMGGPSPKITSYNQNLNSPALTPENLGLGPGNHDEIQLLDPGSFLAPPSPQETYDQAFENQLASFAEEMGLNQEQTAQLRFAHNNPGAPGVARGPTLEKLEKAALQEVKEAFPDLSADWKPATGDTVRANSMAFDYSEAFESVLGEKGLDDKTTNQLRHMHYHPEAGVDDPDGKFQNLLSTLEGSALGQIQGKYGFPKGFEPKSDTARYDAHINAKYLSNPMDISIFMDKMGLPDSWTPPAPGIDTTPGAYLTGAARVIIQNIIDGLDAEVDALKDIIAQMPDGPEKASQLDYMKEISEMLTALKEFLYEIQSLDSAKQRELSEAARDMGEEKVAKMQEKLAKIQADAKKKRDKDAAMKIFGWIMAIVSLVVGFLMGGPVGLAIALAFFIEKVVAEVTGKSGLAALCKAIQDACPTGPGKIAAMVALTIALSVLAGPAGAATAVSIATVVVTESNLVALVAKEAGGSSKDSAIAAAIAVTILAIIGAVAGGKSKGFGKLGKAVRNMTKAMTKFKHATAIKRTMAIVNGTLQATREGIAVSLAVQKAKITLEVGEFEADIEYIDELVKIIKKLINALLSGQGDISELIGDIQGALDSFFKDASGAFTNLSSAS